MTNHLITLKNLYRVMSQPDYPVYSVPPLPAKARKGMTVLSFWTDNILEEFTRGECGRMIWRRDVTKNRFISNICNRGDIRFYREYTDEILAAATPECVVNQILLLKNKAIRSEYDRKLYRMRMKEFILLAAAEDELFPEKLRRYLLQSMAEADQQTDTYKDFFDFWVFGTLMLLALAGTELEYCAEKLLFTDNTYSPQRLYDSANITIRLRSRTEILTTNKVQLAEALQRRGRFFGREEELFDLTEAAAEGRRVFVTGMSGSGKAELMRQVAARLVEEKTVDQIAFVPFIGNLVRSIAAVCFEEGHTPVENAARTVKRLNSYGHSVLIIENLKAEELSTEDEELLREVRGAVLISSAGTALPGFETYRLEPLSDAACGLMFRSVYDGPLSSEMKQKVKRLFREESMRSAMIVRQLALFAKKPGTGADSFFEIAENGLYGKKPGAETGTDMQCRLFRDLYSHAEMSEDEKTATQLFAMLPGAEYPEEYYQRRFLHIYRSEPELNPAMLRGLEQKGWLEQYPKGFYMHSAIAAAIRKERYTEADVAPVLQRILRVNYNRAFRRPAPLTEFEQLDQTVLRALIMCTEPPVSRELLKGILAAVCGDGCNGEERRRLSRRLAELVACCPDADDELYMLLALTMIYLPETERERFCTLARSYHAAGRQDALYTMFICALSVAMLESGEAETAKELVGYLPEISTGEDADYAACTSLWTVGLQTGDFGMLSVAGERAAELYRGGEINSEYGIQLLHMMFVCNQMAGRFENNRRLIHEEYPKLNPGAASQQTQALYYDDLGSALMNEEQYEKAAECMERVYNYLSEYSTVEAERCSAASHYAICMQKLKRFDKAKELYLHALEACRSDEMVMQKHLTGMNYSVLLMDMGETEEAAALLEQIEDFCVGAGGAMEANYLRNRARCARMRGDKEQTRTYLTLAYPKIAALYGESHPRTRELAQWLQDAGLQMPEETGE